MFFNDKKKVSSVILSRMKGNGQEMSADVAPESDVHNEYTSLAEEFFAALESKSVQHLASLFKQLNELGEEYEEPGE